VQACCKLAMISVHDSALIHSSALPTWSLQLRA
jgi:hypothetical protein